MPKLELTSQERSALRATAHPLHPVVLIGDKGLTAAVLKEIDLNLNAHQLIKIRVNGQERAERDATLEAICDQLSCAAVHHLGKTLIIYRPDAEKTRAEEQARNATRAVRKASEPYIPKKQAATGTKPAGRGTTRRPAPETAARTTSRAAPATSAHGIPRRSGSALTLRAGMRRTASPAPRKRSR